MEVQGQSELLCCLLTCCLLFGHQWFDKEERSIESKFTARKSIVDLKIEKILLKIIMFNKIVSPVVGEFLNQSVQFHFDV